MDFQLILKFCAVAPDRPARETARRRVPGRLVVRLLANPAAL